jgi:hypothetical protein
VQFSERAFKRALFFCVRPQIFAIFPTNYTIDKKKNSAENANAKG